MSHHILIPDNKVALELPSKGFVNITGEEVWFQVGDSFNVVRISDINPDFVILEQCGEYYKLPTTALFYRVHCHGWEKTPVAV